VDFPVPPLAALILLLARCFLAHALLAMVELKTCLRCLQSLAAALEVQSLSAVMHLSVQELQHALEASSQFLHNASQHSI
jgi:hypothetical protein